ncbi:MAG: DNA polymerase IV, partial [Planctomycetota bacterium]
PGNGTEAPDRLGPVTGRTTLHADLDAFFASVEQLDRPELRGRPVLVGSARRRGVVATASYEARRHGCHSALPMAIALRRCPDALVVPARFKRYEAISRQVFSIFHEHTPLVGPLGIDEAFLDVTGTERLLGPAVEVARSVRQRVRDEVGLTISVGVAPNKFLAKLASDLEKPDGLTVIRPETVDAVLAPLPIERMWGVGPAAALRMRQHGITTFGDLRRRSVRGLESLFGAAGRHYLRLARGEDERPVSPHGEMKSVSHEQTFEEDLDRRDDVRAVLLHQTEDVGRRLRRKKLLARTVTVKIRFGDFETVTRSFTLPAPTDATGDLWGAASTLFDRWARTAFRPVRLIGMGAKNLVHPAEQMDLFPDPAKQRDRRLDEAVDRIRDRYGRGAIRRRP